MDILTTYSAIEQCFYERVPIILDAMQYVFLPIGFTVGGDYMPRNIAIHRQR